jgi:hypothetical protein
MALFEELAESLNSAALEAFSRSAKKHRDEVIYCAALYTSDGYAYVCDTISTLAGLRRVAAEYVAKGSYATLEAAAHALKWSACDSPYHLENDGLFTEADRLIGEIWKAVEGKGEDESDRVYRELHEVFIAVLKNLRSSGILPTDCIITLLAGDQSYEAIVANTEEVGGERASRPLFEDLEIDAGRLKSLRTNRWPVGGFYEP